ncbi:MAG: choice-of-anchor R domain-containing protein [Verrucomicrobiales bacterium]
MNKHARKIICGLLAAFWAEAVSGATVKTAAYDNPAEYDTGVRIDSSQFLGQAFVAAYTINLTKVSLFLVNLSGTAAAITVEVREDASGVPGAFLGSATLTTTNTTARFIDFDFIPGAVALSAGALYYLTTSNPSPASEGYIWEANRVLGGETGYPDGSAFFSTNQGTSWMPLNSGINNFDVGFQVWGEGIPEPSTVMFLAIGTLALVLGATGRARNVTR